MQECNSWQCINSFAPWLSALGTILTSSLALWLSVKDRRVNISAVLNVGLIPSKVETLLDRQVFILTYTNIGYRKVTVTNHCWTFPLIKGIIFFNPNMDREIGSLCPQSSQELEDGQQAHVFYRYQFFLELDKPEDMLFPESKILAWLRINYFKVYIRTTVGRSVRVKIKPAVRRELWNQYISLR